MAFRREPTTRMASGLRAPSATGNTRTRTSSRMSSRDGAISPAESLASVATTSLKRKERDFDSEATIPVVEETNINVVVRCRGRNEREVKENSAVVIQADGVRGKLLELKMGSNALNDKTYNFDRVFSQAADQSMVFDDVVKPILDEVRILTALLQVKLTSYADARGLQLHNPGVRPNGHRQNIHHVR
jgi:kinesin family member 11